MANKKSDKDSPWKTYYKANLRAGLVLDKVWSDILSFRVATCFTNRQIKLQTEETLLVIKYRQQVKSLFSKLLK